MMKDSQIARRPARQFERRLQERSAILYLRELEKWTKRKARSDL